MGPHEANGINAIDRPGAPACWSGVRSATTRVPAISGPTAATRNAAFQPARDATAPASASDSAVPRPNDAV